MSELESLADLLPAAAADRPDSTALLFAGGRLTWAELDAAVEQVADALRRIGLTAGDRVAISLGRRASSSQRSMACCEPAWSRFR